jgi:hypothetical protein
VSALTKFQAKQFFVNKIILQTQIDRIALSEAEQYMLNWSEVENDFKIDEALTDEFNKQTTNEKFEKKISVLIEHAFETDVKRDPKMKRVYHQAYRVLCKGDYYLNLMIDDAFRRYAKGSRIKDKLLLVITALGLTMGFVGTAIYLSKWFSDQWIDFMFACMLYMILYLGYSFFTFKFTKTSRFSTVFFQVIVAGVLIGIYVLLFKYRVIPMPSDSERKVMDFIVMLPLLFISLFLLDFWRKEGVFYIIARDYIKQLRPLIKKCRSRN